MVKIEKPLGTIELSHGYFAELIGSAASSCFGVAGMANSNAMQGIRTFVTRRDHSDKGVAVRVDGNSLNIDLHIIVTFGLNISETVKSIIHKVKFVVEEATGLKVKRVNVFVDGLKSE